MLHQRRERCVPDLLFSRPHPSLLFALSYQNARPRKGYFYLPGFSFSRKEGRNFLFSRSFCSSLVVTRAVAQEEGVVQKGRVKKIRSRQQEESSHEAIGTCSSSNRRMCGISTSSQTQKLVRLRLKFISFCWQISVQQTTKHDGEHRNGRWVEVLMAHNWIPGLTSVNSNRPDIFVLSWRVHQTWDSINECSVFGLIIMILLVSRCTCLPV